MNQRTAGRGRPSGTDGSDFSYRMVVDSSYTKVAKAKSRLAKLIFAQVVTHLMIAANVFVSLINKESPNRVSVSSLAVGFVSILAGELGRKRNRSSLLKFYAFGSSMSILLSVAYLAMSNLSLEVRRSSSDHLRRPRQAAQQRAASTDGGGTAGRRQQHCEAGEEWSCAANRRQTHRRTRREQPPRNPRVDLPTPGAATTSATRYQQPLFRRHLTFR